MKIFNRLNEIHLIKKYSKYLDNELIPAVSKSLSLEFTIDRFSDPYTYTYRTTFDVDNSYTDVVLEFTTNRKNIEGLFWGTFRIFGKKLEIGSITGELDYDLAIIEDTYYDYFEHEGNNGTVPRF